LKNTEEEGTGRDHARIFAKVLEGEHKCHRVRVKLRRGQFKVFENLCR
jgi:hypothetical protein